MTDDIIKSLRCNVDNLCWKFRLKRCRLQKDILMENNLKIVHRITIVVMFTDIFIRIFYFAKKIIIQRLSLRCHSFWIILNLLSVQLTIIFTKKCVVSLSTMLKFPILADFYWILQNQLEGAFFGAELTVRSLYQWQGGWAAASGLVRT